MIYYHLSFDNTLEGFWSPRVPIGSGGSGVLSEPEIPRICFSPTIEQCFQAIYPNISEGFEVSKRPTLLYLYSPKTLYGVVPNDEVCSYIHDAHITKEFWLTERNEVFLIGEILVFPSTLNYPDLMYLPFDKPGEEYYISPSALDYDLTLY